jgi:hypothetical protein
MHRTLLGLRASSLLALCCLVVVIVGPPVHAADFGAGFKTQAVTVDEGTLSVTVDGSGPPVVLSRRHSRLKVDDESAVRRAADTAERYDINADLLAFIKA